MRDWTFDEIKSVAERLRGARINAGFDRATEAVRKYGWNYSRYMNYENGERPIPPKQAILFATAYGVTVDYIYFGKTEFKQCQSSTSLMSRLVQRIPLIRLDDLDEVQRIASGYEPMPTVTIPVAEEEAFSRTIFIEISDKSMSNARERISFEPGDKVLIDLDASPTPSEYVLALVPNEKSALFRLYRELGLAEDGSLIVDLVPLNPNFRTVRISTDSPGEIVGVSRRIHRIVDL